MTDWQQRVIDEREQLDERIGRLQKFVRSETYNKLTMGHRHLLDKQLTIMQQYSYVLYERIALFQ